MWGRFLVAVRHGLSPLVGRQETLEALLNSWQEAKNGTGQVVLLNCNSSAAVSASPSPTRSALPVLRHRH